MSATPTQSLPGTPVRGRWVSIAAGAALVCALTPLLPILSITPWSSLIVDAPYAALVLAGVTLWATRGSRGRRQRQFAKLALAAICFWLLLGLFVGLELLYG